MVNYVKLLIAIASMLMLSSLALAVPENSQLGPYAVSFDMNTDLGHHKLIPGESVQIPSAENYGIPSATIYGVQIFTDNATNAFLTISEYTSPVDSTLGQYKQMLNLQARFSGFNITNVVDRTIDGKAGFVLTSEPVPENTAIPAGYTLYRASYWMDSTSCDCGPVSAGTIRVDIASTYPQDMTESLLNSLKVVKGPATAMPPASMPPASSSMDMPPATN